MESRWESSLSPDTDRNVWRGCVRPAVAWRGIAACFAGGSIVLAALTFATNGGILRHLFLYNVNRFAPNGLELIPAVMLDHALFFAAVGAGLFPSLAAAASGMGAARRRFTPALPDDTRDERLRRWHALLAST